MREICIYFIVITNFFIYSGCSSNNIGTSGSSGGTASSSSSSTAYAAFSVQVNGAPVQVVRMTNYDVPVSYVRFDWPGSSCSVAVTVNGGSAASYTVSPLSKNIVLSVSGNTISFAVAQPEYLVFQVTNGSQERLLVLIDPAEVNPPRPGDANVTNIMSFTGMDNTGATNITSAVQSAIDQASGSAQNILYFPPGRYNIKYLNLRNNMTVYLADGAVLGCSTTPAELLSSPSGYSVIEGCSIGFINMNGVNNAHLTGRGTIDGNGRYLKSSNRKMNLIKIEESSGCTVEGIISRDSCFWTTLIYRSSNIGITNYKVVNNRLSSTWNETDGVDFDNCINCNLYNALLYDGDDCMAVKSDDIPDGQTYGSTVDPTTGSYMSVNNITHRKIVCFGYGGCKVGTKTIGNTISNVTYDDIDVVLVDRALVIDADDTASVNGTLFNNIRIERVTGRLIDLDMDVQSIFWRTAYATGTISNTCFSNITAGINRECRLMGTDHYWITDISNSAYGQTNYVDGVYFYNFTILGSAVTSLANSLSNFNVNAYVKNVVFN